MFGKLGSFIYNRRWLVLIASLVFLVASGVYGTSVFSKLKNGGFYDPGADSTKVMEALPDKLGRDDDYLLVLFTSKNGVKAEDPAYKAEVEKTFYDAKASYDEALAKQSDRDRYATLGSINSFYTTGSQAFISNDGKSTYGLIGLRGDDDAQGKTFGLLKPFIKSDTLNIQLGGSPAVNAEMTAQIQKDLEHAETLTFPILAVLLIFIFGSLVAAALPLAIGGTVILGAFLVLRVTSDFADVSVFAINIITMLGFGLAIDYGLFVVSRFREELASGLDVQPAIVRTMQTAGRTVVFSGLTVAISLLSLLVFPQAFLKSMGWGGTAAVLVAMLAAVTILPAILALLGHRINSLSVAPLFRRLLPRRNRVETVKTERQGFWYNLSMLVMRRPGLFLVATLVPLLIVGLPFLRVKLSVADAKSLPATSEARIVTERLDTDFPRSETVPIQPFATFEKPATDPESISALYDYTRQLEKVPGVTGVSSMVNLDPRLNKEAYVQFYSEQGLAQNPQAQRALASFSKENYSLVSVHYNADVTSDTAQNLVREIRKVDVPAGMSVMVGGWSAVTVDFLQSLGGAMPWAVLLIVGAIFVLLFLMLGSVVVPLKAVILNILSLSMTFGALVWIFQDGNMSNLLGFTSLGSIEGSQPVLIFAIAFGLSMDYEVFLLSRIKEHYDKTGDNTASVALGVQKTGAIITSAALLLVIVFGGFATGQIIFIKMVGLGLALAVLVDATLVRMLLVPATMRLMGDFNWWAPAPLKRLYERLGLGEKDDVKVLEPAESVEPATAPGKREPATVG